MTSAILLIAALLLVVACGIFVAAEFALITVNRSSVDRLADKGDRQAQGVAKALQTLSTQLSGAQVGITITNLAIGFLAEPAISHLLREPLLAASVPPDWISGISVGIGIGIATVVTMLFGELIPKNLAIARPLGTAKKVQAFQRGFSTAMRLPIHVLNGSANAILRQIGVAPQEELASARSADELTSLVRRSAEKGTLPKETALMLERSLTFNELTASDVMTPRVRVKTVNADENLEAVLAIAKASGLSRFPVVGNSLDDVVGIIHIKQVLGIPKNKRSRTPVRQIMQQPIVAPSSIQLDSLLETLRKGGLQMAVIIDEFGGTDGIVTIEDLIEELVGEVQDEHDRARSAIRPLQGGGWQLSGLLRPDEIGERLGIFLPDEEEFETIGGLVAFRLEKVPGVGDQVEIPAVDRDGRSKIAALLVERMDGRRVDRVHMQVTDASHPREHDK